MSKLLHWRKVLASHFLFPSFDPVYDTVLFDCFFKRGLKGCMIEDNK